ncbi:MAG: aldo/keto reductase [Gammaproteobacteria bacterium]|nr:MAG: aldo/keto reductase [Gammaproteobacteria bacterium]UCH40628.1 MAG: aldo/keto reductase [Gammaproteobacteria bacterium]
MRNLNLPSGNSMPVFGLGTWRMGEHSDQFQQEADAIRAALDMGVRLIDTAEMYGEGGAEEVIGEAIRGRRDDVFLVSKFYPHNASRNGVMEACERSLRRMDCDYIDLYLQHWPGSVPPEQTFEALHELQQQGKIRDFGVSNFNLTELQQIPAADQTRLGCNQVFYNLAHREVEWEVSAWCRDRGIPVMAYSPLDQASSLLSSSAVTAVAERHSVTPAQVALAWLLHQPDTVVIPKSSRPERIQENLDAVSIELGEEDMAELDDAFPAPDRAVRLGMR